MGISKVKLEKAIVIFEITTIEFVKIQSFV